MYIEYIQYMMHIHSVMQYLFIHHPPPFSLPHLSLVPCHHHPFSIPPTLLLLYLLSLLFSYFSYSPTSPPPTPPTHHIDILITLLLHLFLFFV